MAFLAVAAATAGDVERHGADVAFLDEFHVRTDFDDLGGHLVPHHHPLRRREAAVIDMLVAAADVGRHDLQNRTVIRLLSRGRHQLGVVESLQLHLSRALEGNYAISTSHDRPPF